MANPNWIKGGPSPNPAGKPPKSRALTDILEAAGNQTVTDGEGKHTARKRFLARALWGIATTGKATLLDDKVLEVAPADYLAVVKFLYQQIDGPPPQAVKLGGEDGGPVVIRVKLKEPGEE